jgi:cytosine/adenosine deaminase-related metal-dependent hydrolase
MIYSAEWVCPIDRPPIRNGAVRVEDGRIVWVGPYSEISSETARWFGDAVLMPGLVNAHTHLELSWLRGQVPPAPTFIDWVRAMFAVRGRPDSMLSKPQMLQVSRAIDEVRAAGTAAVGDISNAMKTEGHFRHSGFDGVMFHELLGFAERDGALVERTREVRQRVQDYDVTVSLAPHAPYSTSIELFKAIRAAVNDSACPIMSVHLGESPEEVELLEKGTGPWRDMLQAIGAWRDDWQAPGCDPVTYLDRHGVIDAKTLVVHAVQLTDEALRRLAEIGATVVTCPRSNKWVGVGYPPIERFYRSGVKVAVGTDSLASVEDLNVFSELRAMRWLAPGIPARTLLQSATLVGATALGLGDELGSLTAGKRAAMIAVDLPKNVADVEEYLLRGIEPAQIQWVD